MQVIALPFILIPELMNSEGAFDELHGSYMRVNFHFNHILVPANRGGTFSCICKCVFKIQ